MKKALIGLAVSVLLLLGAALFIPHFVDVNNYKGTIVSVVKEQTGRTLAINGRIGLTVIPDIALTLDDASLQGGSGDGGRFLDISKLILKLKWWPLLQGRVEVDSFELVKPHIYLEVAESGAKNWEVAVQADAVSSEQVAGVDRNEGDEGGSEAALRAFQFNEIKISAGSLTYKDATLGEVVQFSDLNLTTSFGGTKNPFSLYGKQSLFGGKVQNFSVKGAFSADKNYYELSGVHVQLANTKAQLDATADLRPSVPEVEVALYTDFLDINTFLPPLQKSDAERLSRVAEAFPASVKPRDPLLWGTQPLPFESMKGINAHVSFKAGGIVYEDIALQNVAFNSFLKNGRLTTTFKDIQGYEGSASGELVIDITSGMPTVSQKLYVTNLNLEKIPESIAPVLRYVEGKFEMRTELSTRGINEKELVENLSGSGDMKMTEGRFRGLDLLAMAGNVSSAFDIGNTLDRRTKFQDIGATFQVEKGIISNDDFLIQAPAMDFKGKGTIDLPKWLINYRITPTLRAGDAAGKGGFRVPVIVKGRLDSPVFLADVITPINSIIQNPESAKNMVKQLKKDFKTMRKDMEKDLKEGVINDLKGILQGL